MSDIIRLEEQCAIYAMAIMDCAKQRDRLTAEVGRLLAALAAAETERDAQAKDAARLDGLERMTDEGHCPGIINDDNGHWAVSETGAQNVVAGDEAQDVQTTFFVEAHEWRNTLREAIDAALAEVTP